MFYKVELKDHIRVPPDLFGLALNEAVIKRIRAKYTGYISQDLGVVIDVSEVDSIGEGIIVPGDGASYYDVKFKLLTFKPELQEVVIGKIRDIADFGAFMTIGPIDGMIHISQAMDDFVSFSKDKTLAGKESKKTLRVNDVCRSRVIAVSYKDPMNPKIGLTMRQAGLGRLDWIEAEQKKEEGAEEGKEEKSEKKEEKKGKEKKAKEKKK
ncbi:DNA-directed RNA polymerase [Candidatus Woesearchaeota archaeon]|nr:DNA-directed RNA polymerase [Candidatus Woesearchaeota archaeon]